jgi:tetratricopeptide (TPR) repeat protein/predicted Ser/Thr protein kinase
MIGRVVSHYRIVERLGSGGMGVVYKAHDLRLGRPAALKFLPEELSKDSHALERFEREARAASALNHPNICTIYEIDEHDKRPFIAMEFLEGQTLREMVAQGPVPARTLFRIALEVCEGLEAAHGEGITHRDIKPANIFVTRRGIAKILDFGLARMGGPSGVVEDLNQAATADPLTRPGVILGTWFYMSPEQIRGESLDARSDIFSLGVVLYEAATGRRPFQGASNLALMHDIAVTRPTAPTVLRTDLPAEFDSLIERTLAKDRDERHTAVTLLEALRNTAGSFQSGVFFLRDQAAPPRGVESAPATKEFVGRDRELERLEKRMDQAAQGSGGIVFITGEPGIGKTALADQFLDHARQRHPQLIVARGRSIENYGTGEAYLPFLEALGALLSRPGGERVVSILRKYAPTWSMQFPAVFAASSSVEQAQRDTIGATKERMLREMGDALEALASAAPVAVMLEDMHWADPSSTDLLRHLGHRAPRLRLLLVATFRPEDVELSSHPLKGYKREMQAHQLCEEIALDSLEEKNLAAYLNLRFDPHDFPAGFASLIHRKTEGHALFATGLLQFLVDRGDIVRDNVAGNSGRWTLARPLSEVDLEFPQSVRGMIQKKMEALDEETRRILRYASVEGAEFTSTVLAHLLGVDEVVIEERLDVLEKAHRWIQAIGEEELPDGALSTRYRFAHVLYQNIFYNDVVSKRRIGLHRQAGEQMLRHYGSEAARIAAPLAMHFERGRDFGRAIDYLQTAGDHAIKIFANGEAETYYSRALALVERLPADEHAGRRLALYERRGGAHFALSRFPKAAEDFRHMRECAKVLGVITSECAAMTALAGSLFFSHQMQEMPQCAEEALHLAKRAGSETLHLNTNLLIAMKHTCYGELDSAKPLLEEIIGGARRLDHKPALLGGLSWRGAIHFFQSEYRAAETVLAEAHGLAEELRDGFMLLISLFFTGLTQGNLGRMSEALASLQEGLDRAGRNGDHFWFPRLPNCIGWIHRELGDDSGAFEHNRQGLEVARQHHVLEAEANSLINLAMDYTHRGETAETEAAFHKVDDIFHRDAWFRWRYNIRRQAAGGQQWLAQGDLDKAAEHAQRLLAEAGKYGSRKYLVVGHKLLSDIAVARNAFDLAEIELSIAQDILAEYPTPVTAWKVQAARGQLCLKRGQTAEASQAFSQAADIIRGIAANVHDERLRTGFLESAPVHEVLENSLTS